MMVRILTLVLAFILLLVPVARGASRPVIWEIGIQRRADWSDCVLGSWGDTWQLALGAASPLAAGTESMVRVSLRSSGFQSLVGGSIMSSPEDRLDYTTGDRTTAGELTMGLRFSGAGRVRGSVSLRTGVLLADVGEVRQHWSNMFDPDDEWERVVYGTGGLATKVIHAVSIGIDTQLQNGWRAGLESEFGTSSDQEVVWFSLGACVRFG